MNQSMVSMVYLSMIWDGVQWGCLTLSWSVSLFFSNSFEAGQLRSMENRDDWSDISEKKGKHATYTSGLWSQFLSNILLLVLFQLSMRRTPNSQVAQACILSFHPQICRLYLWGTHLFFTTLGSDQILYTINRRIIRERLLNCTYTEIVNGVCL